MIIKDFYIKTIIFSFIRNHEYKVCDLCYKICRWNNKKINSKHLEFNKEIICFECFIDRFFTGLNLKN